MYIIKMPSLNLDAIQSTTTLFPEANNSSLEATSETQGSGIFIPPSSDVVIGAGPVLRTADVTGFFAVAATSEGKLEWNSGDGLLSLDELSDVTITNPSYGEYLCYDETTSMWINSKINTIHWKEPVRLATTVQLAALSGVILIDGIATAAGDRVLVKDGTLANPGTTSVDNGIYVVAAGAWSRSDDMVDGFHASGSAMIVEEGTTLADTSYICITDPPTDVVGTDTLTFTIFGSGDVRGPASSVDNAVCVFDGVTGKLIKESSVTISATGAIEGSESISIKNGAGAATVLQCSVASTVTAPLTLPAADAVGVTVLQNDGAGNLSWVSDAGGDVVGPASSVDNAICLFDGVTGKLIKESVVTVNAGAASGFTSIGCDTLSATTSVTAPLLTNPTSLKITTGIIDIEGKLESSGTAPVSVVGTGNFAGQVSVDANSTDTAGQINCNATGAATDTITVNYSSSYSSIAQHVFLSAQDLAASTGIVNGYYVTTTASSFTITFIGVTGINPNFHYFVIDSIA